MIENISQFWYRFAFDIAITFGLFFRDFVIFFFIWALVLTVVVLIILAGGVEEIPEFLAISIMTVPGTIDLLIVVISWVYLSGCIHKYIKKYNFWFDTYFADMYE